MKLHIARVVAAFWLVVLSLTSLTLAQTPAQTASALPRLVRFGGAAQDINGNPLTGVVGITFAFYSEKTGGAPLWLETQNATADSSGHYTVLLGSTHSEGLPADLFTSEQARWVGVQVSGQAEQPRVLLVSAPYALKAGDAETIGGLPPSAFVLAKAPAIGWAGPGRKPAPEVETVSPSVATDVTTTGGTADYLPIFSGANTIIDSAVFQTGSATTAKIGINTATPATALDVVGAATVRGTLTLATTGNATATAGKNSQAQVYTASAYNSGTAAAVAQKFQWQAEPAGNDTATPSGTLNLLFASGTSTPTETGLKLSSKGVFTFAPGQTFPGGGSFCIATAGGFGGGGTTYIAPSFTVPGENKCTTWSGFTKTASTVLLITSGGACLSNTGETLTVSVSSADPDFVGTTPVADYILLTRTSSTGSFTGGSDQGEFSGSADQITCTSSLLSLPDTHD